MLMHFKLQANFILVGINSKYIEQPMRMFLGTLPTGRHLEITSCNFLHWTNFFQIHVLLGIPFQYIFWYGNKIVIIL